MSRRSIGPSSRPPLSRSDGWGWPARRTAPNRTEHEPHQLVPGGELHQHNAENHQQPGRCDGAQREVRPGRPPRHDAADGRGPSGQHGQQGERGGEHRHWGGMPPAGAFAAQAQPLPDDRRGGRRRQQRDVAGVPQRAQCAASHDRGRSRAQRGPRRAQRPSAQVGDSERDERDRDGAHGRLRRWRLATTIRSRPSRPARCDTADGLIPSAAASCFLVRLSIKPFRIRSDRSSSDPSRWSRHLRAALIASASSRLCSCVRAVAAVPRCAGWLRAPPTSPARPGSPCRGRGR